MKIAKIILPIVVLIIAGMVAWRLLSAESNTEIKTVQKQVPAVTVATVVSEPLKLNVFSQGVVSPRTKIQLVPEVAGRIVAIHPAFADGGFFKAGDTLIRIDARDYDYAVTRARALVAEARKELLREQAEARQAEDEWAALGSGTAEDYVLHKPHLAERRAKLAAAEADFAEARLRFSRCELKAPFAGRVRDKNADVGQYVEAGQVLAVLFSTDRAEVRLPIAADQIEHLSLPLHAADAGRPGFSPAVTVRARFAGQLYEWSGRIVRTEGTIDEKTGMLYAVAEIIGPYDYHPSRPPLAAGLFVNAEIEGLERSDLVKIPRRALRSGHQVFVVDSDLRLQPRSVDVSRSDSREVVISRGLAPGDRILAAGVELPVAGMQVSIAKVAGSSS